MRLRVGVIGLGRRWRRYRPALAALRGHLEVRAVCDQVLRHAAVEARRMRCAAAAGCVELLTRGDVDALLLLDAQWFGLWPLGRACQAGKPVFCAVPPDGEADALRAQVRDAGLPVLMALAPVLAPAAVRLRDLLTHRLGPARLVRGDGWLDARRSESTDVLRSALVLPLLAGCAALFDAEPQSVWTVADDGPAFATLVLAFGTGRLAQVNLWSGPAVRTACRIEVVAEKGTAAAELPGRLRWQDDDGRHEQRLRPCPLEQSQLDRFVTALRTNQPLRPNFEDACRALAWLHAARQSRDEGRRVTLASGG
jgi:predicted dehydrogenase